MAVEIFVEVINFAWTIFIPLIKFIKFAILNCRTTQTTINFSGFNAALSILYLVQIIASLTISN